MRLFAALALALALAGCDQPSAPPARERTAYTADQLRQTIAGKTRDQVLEVLGPPTFEAETADGHRYDYSLDDPYRPTRFLITNDTQQGHYGGVSIEISNTLGVTRVMPY